MKDSTPDRTGVLIVRLWIEANHETGLRARITQTLDTTATEQSVAIAASADGICALVKHWVEAFADPSSPDGNGEVTTGSDNSSVPPLLTPFVRGDAPVTHGGES